MIYNLLNKLLIPFAIIHIRIIQYRYKKITLGNDGSHTNSNLNKLLLLQMKEYYYERQFDAWGKFHPSFSFSYGDGYNSMRHHVLFTNWLFPEKKFQEWDIVIWHNPRAVTYYHNKIFTLQNGASCIYKLEIPKQIKKWKTNHDKNFYKK